MIKAADHGYQKPDTGRDPFNQNLRKFRSKTEWIGSVQTEKFRKIGPPFDVDHFYDYFAECEIGV